MMERTEPAVGAPVEAPEVSDLLDLSDLPEGWASCMMRDISRVVGGGTPKANEPANSRLTVTLGSRPLT